MATVADLGEFRLIEAIARRIGEQIEPGRFPELLVGIGDDTAVWRRNGLLELAKTDALVEGIDFLRTAAAWQDVGWKALAVNLSDIAAMGGRPDYALVTLGIPRDENAENILDLYTGMADLASQFDVALIGGDISAAQELFISVAVTGRSSQRGRGRSLPLLLRSTARPGHVLAVTGTVGTAAAGLHVLLAAAGHANAIPAAGSLLPGTVAFFRQAQLRPMPRLVAGQRMIEAGIRCGMDISDGLVADAEKLCQASRVDAVVEIDRIPVDPRVRAAFPDCWQELVLAGGEDFELLVAGPSRRMEQAQQSIDVPLTVIGRVEAGDGRVRVLDGGGRPVDLKKRGWVHF